MSRLTSFWSVVLSALLVVVSFAPPAPNLAQAQTNTWYVAATGNDAKASGSVALQVSALSLQTNDLLFDPVGQRLWASTPSSVGTSGNSVIPISLPQQVIGTPIFVGSEPNRLAIAEDGSYLYVGLDGAAAIRRVNLISQTAEIQIPLGSSWCGPWRVEDMVVSKNNSKTVVVSRRNSSCSSRHEGVAVYDDGVQRPVTTPKHINANVIEPSDRDSILYGYDNETTGFRFHVLSVYTEGIVITSSTGSLISGFGTDIHYDNGLVYATSGAVINPTTLTLAGTYSAQGLVQSDNSTGRVYFLSQEWFGGKVTLRIFNQATFTHIVSYEIPNVAGTVSSFVKAGDGRLAFRSSGGQVIVLGFVELNNASYLPLVGKNACSDFFDDFSNPNSGWFSIDSSLRRFGYLDGEYQMRSKQSGYLFLVRAPACPRENYVVEADFRWNGNTGSDLGLLFGLQGDFDRFYYFVFNTDYQAFALFRFEPDAVITLISPRQSFAIRSGTSANRARVTRNGSQITLEMNSVIIGVAFDGAITGLGHAGLAMAPYDDVPEADARVDNFRFTTLPGSALSLEQLEAGALPALEQRPSPWTPNLDAVREARK